MKEWVKWTLRVILVLVIVTLICLVPFLLVIAAWSGIEVPETIRWFICAFVIASLFAILVYLCGGENETA